MEKQFICCHKLGAWTILQGLQPCLKAKTATGRRHRSPPPKAGIDAGQFVYKLSVIVIVLWLWYFKKVYNFSADMLQVNLQEDLLFRVVTLEIEQPNADFIPEISRPNVVKTENYTLIFIEASATWRLEWCKAVCSLLMIVIFLFNLLFRSMSSFRGVRHTAVQMPMLRGSRRWLFFGLRSTRCGKSRACWLCLQRAPSCSLDEQYVQYSAKRGLQRGLRTPQVFGLGSASEMTCIVSSGALNSTYSLW